MLGDDLAPLELLDGGEHLVLRRPQLFDQDDLGGHLELGELGGGAGLLDVLEHLVRVRVRVRARVGVRVRVRVRVRV